MQENKPKITILGGFGFIGRYLVSRLLRDGFPVTVFGHASHKEIAGAAGGSLRYCYGDFANAAELETAISGCDVVFHLVGNTVPQSSNENPRFDVDAHVGPSITLLDLCVKCRVRQLIFTSSGGTVYGVPRHLPIDEGHPTFPISSYGIQKLTIEHYLRLYNLLHGLNATVLRLSNPYGPGQNIGRHQGIVATICNKIRHNETIEIWGDGTVVRDYVFVEDLAEAMRRTVLSVDGYNVFNIGTGIGTSVNEILGSFAKVGRAEPRVTYRAGRAVDIPVNILNVAKFKKAFDWEPRTDLSAGVERTLSFYLEQG
jgi:UDP-glucose 4-epimerase